MTKQAMAQRLPLTRSTALALGVAAALYASESHGAPPGEPVAAEEPAVEPSTGDASASAAEGAQSDESTTEGPVDGGATTADPGAPTNEGAASTEPAAPGNASAPTSAERSSDTGAVVAGSAEVAAPAVVVEEKTETQKEDTDEAEPETFGMPPEDPILMDSHTANTEKIRYRPGKGLEIKSEDKKFGMQMRLRAQMLYTLEHDNDADPVAEHGFQIRRARLAFKGNFFGEHNKFKAEFAVAPKDIGLNRGDGTISKSPLLDWYFEFDHLKSLTLRVGQYKIPFSRQRVISSGNLQMVDRTIANKEFTLDRDVGFDIRSKDFLGAGWFRYYLGIYMGEGHSSFENGDFGMNYLARVEFLPMGQFDDYKEADHARLKKPRLSIGAAYAFLDEGKRVRGITGSKPEDGGTSDYHNGEVDFVFKFAGWSLMSEVFMRSGTRNAGPIIDEDGNPILDDDGDPIAVTDPRNAIGYTVQSGFMIPKTRFELAGRFSQNRPIGSDTSASQAEELGGAASYYFARHPFKLQADYFRLFNEGDVTDGNHMIRVQVQGSF